MLVVDPYARIKLPRAMNADRGVELLRDVEYIGRVSHRSEEAQTETSWGKFLRANILGHGDWSIAEHVHVTVDAVVDRGITHEWVRHRIGAYTQESTRFINYAKKHTKTQEYVNPAKFICPPTILAMKPTENGWIYNRWENGRKEDEEEYMLYLANGVRPEEARNCLPNSLASRLVATYNLRMWRHFFLMRTTREAHIQMRQVTIPLLADFKRWIPILYEDIEPEAKQSDNLKMMR